MYNSNPPSNDDLPTTRKLIKSTILAAVAASVLLVTVVMPAEYGIDPTRIGKMVGLKKVGEIKTSLAKDAAAEAAKELVAELGTTPVTSQLVASVAPEKKALSTPEINTLNHETKVTLAPDGWVEVKLVMERGGKVEFVWSTDGSKVNFDTHADSKALKIDYHNYAKGSKIRDTGILEAEFSGHHGWYWRNRTNETITITLQTEGAYLDILQYD